MRYHTKNIPLGPQTMWEFEARSIGLQATEMLLVRVLVAKVTNKQRIENILRDVPVVQGDDAWNCVVWVQKALEAIHDDGKAVGTSQLDWRTVRDVAMKYVKDKQDQRRFESGSGFDMTKPATFDLLAGHEVVP